MSAYLKPCPFCAGDKIRANYIRDGQSLGCSDCSASVCAYNPNAGDKCIELWNRRTAPVRTGWKEPSIEERPY